MQIKMQNFFFILLNLLFFPMNSGGQCSKTFQDFAKLQLVYNYIPNLINNRNVYNFYNETLQKNIGVENLLKSSWIGPTRCKDEYLLQICNRRPQVTQCAPDGVMECHCDPIPNQTSLVKPWMARRRNYGDLEVVHRIEVSHRIENVIFCLPIEVEPINKHFSTLNDVPVKFFKFQFYKTCKNRCSRIGLVPFFCHEVKNWAQVLYVGEMCVCGCSRSRVRGEGRILYGSPTGYRDTPFQGFLIPTRYDSIIDSLPKYHDANDDY